MQLGGSFFFFFVVRRMRTVLVGWRRGHGFSRELRRRGAFSSGNIYVERTRIKRATRTPAVQARATKRGNSFRQRARPNPRLQPMSGVDGGGGTIASLFRVSEAITFVSNGSVTPHFCR
jgi:hypothetical protein